MTRLLACWMTVTAMALNDLLLVNQWLIPRPEDREPSTPYIRGLLSGPLGSSKSV